MEKTLFHLTVDRRSEKICTSSQEQEHSQDQLAADDQVEEEDEAELRVPVDSEDEVHGEDVHVNLDNSFILVRIQSREELLKSTLSVFLR